MWRRVGSYLGFVEEYEDDDYIDLRDAGDERRSPEAPDNVRALREEEPAAARRASLRAVGQRSPQLTSPSTFNDVEEVGARFRSGTPVIMNLQGADEAVAKRLLDFASGLTYGLDGRIERVGDRVFLLTPAGVEISDEERRRLSDRGFFAQV